MKSRPENLSLRLDSSVDAIKLKKIAGKSRKHSLRALFRSRKRSQSPLNFSSQSKLLKKARTNSRNPKILNLDISLGGHNNISNSKSHKRHFSNILESHSVSGPGISLRQHMKRIIPKNQSSNVSPTHHALKKLSRSKSKPRKLFKPEKGLANQHKRKKSSAPSIPLFQKGKQKSLSGSRSKILSLGKRSPEKMKTSKLSKLSILNLQGSGSKIFRTQNGIGRRDYGRSSNSLSSMLLKKSSSGKRDLGFDQLRARRKRDGRVNMSYVLPNHEKSDMSLKENPYNSYFQK